MGDSPAKIIADASGRMDSSRTQVMSALAAATFRIGLIIERGLMRQRISPGSDYGIYETADQAIAAAKDRR